MLILLFSTLLSAAPPTPGSEALLNEPTLGGVPQTARALGMGGASRALASGVDAIFANPAGMSTARHYWIELGYGYGQEAVSHKAFASVVDSETTVVAAGLAYSFEHRGLSDPVNAKQSVDAHRVHFALSYGVGMLTLGVGGKYQKVSNDAQGFNVDAGASLTPIAPLTLSVVGYNLIYRQPKTRAANDAQTLQPFAVGVGVGVHLSQLEIGADALADFQSVVGEIKDANQNPQQVAKTFGRFNFGAEYTLVGVVPLRAGFIIDRIARDNFWSAGVGYSGGVFGIDAGFRQAIQAGSNRTFSVSLRFNLQ